MNITIKGKSFEADEGIDPGRLNYSTIDLISTFSIQIWLIHQIHVKLLDYTPTKRQGLIRR